MFLIVVETSANSNGTAQQRQQKRAHTLESEENMCHDPGCGRLVAAAELIACKGPACGGVVCISCSLCTYFGVD